MMTAVVFMEGNPDLMQPVTIERSDVFQASTTRVKANNHVTTGDLLHLLLIASDNAAARALGTRVGGWIRGVHPADEREGVGGLGLESTHYAEQLLSETCASAYDLARLISVGRRPDCVHHAHAQNY